MLLHKCSWVLVTLLTPEIVLYYASSQYRDASELVAWMKRIAKSKRDEQVIATDREKGGVSLRYDKVTTSRTDSDNAQEITEAYVPIKELLSEKLLRLRLVKG